MATVYSSETQYAESTYRPVAMTDSYDREPYEYGGQPELVRDSKRGRYSEPFGGSSSPSGVQGKKAIVVDSTRLTGRCLWFDARKNYGAIQPDASLGIEAETGHSYIFVHGNDVEPGSQPPRNGDAVEFCRGTCPRGRTKAAKVVVLASAAAPPGAPSQASSYYQPSRSSQQQQQLWPGGSGVLGGGGATGQASVSHQQPQQQQQQQAQQQQAHHQQQAGGHHQQLAGGHPQQQQHPSQQQAQQQQQQPQQREPPPHQGGALAAAVQQQQTTAQQQQQAYYAATATVTPQYPGGGAPGTSSQYGGGAPHASNPYGAAAAAAQAASSYLTNGSAARLAAAVSYGGTPAQQGATPAVQAQASSQHRALGRVKWFDRERKSYGFITPADGSPDLFMHAGDVLGSTKTLGPGDAVEFDYGVQPQSGRPKALEVVRLVQHVVSDEDEDDGRTTIGKFAPGDEPLFDKLRVTGTVARFDATHRWGFIAPDDASLKPPNGGDNFFVHGLDVLDASDANPIDVGQHVEFAVVRTRSRRCKAVQVLRVDERGVAAAETTDATNGGSTDDQKDDDDKRDDQDDHEDTQQQLLSREKKQRDAGDDAVILAENDGDDDAERRKGGNNDDAADLKTSPEDSMDTSAAAPDVRVD
mmetsp:Transcript_24204/g.78067  ORF Transcript_24204/g.78067 Transcript_24204/m.78067 type:complete len:641 (+) Transcript_24204:87-2009(+)